MDGKRLDVTIEYFSDIWSWQATKIEFKLEPANFKKIEKHIHDVFPNKHEWIQADLNDFMNQAIQGREIKIQQCWVRYGLYTTDWKKPDV